MEQTSSGHSVIPQGELKCVWMDAGVTAFKLCDLELRCESCDFNTKVLNKQREDAMIESQGARHADPKDRALTAEAMFKQTLKKHLDNLRMAEIPQDRIYSRSNFWVQQTDSGNHRVGINHILAKFFQPILSIVVSKAPINIHKHDPFCWIVLPGGAITLRSPIDATITRFNPALQHRPNMLTAAPFAEGWLMEINTKAKGLNGFASSVEPPQHHDRAIQNIEHYFGQAFKHHHPTAGKTLFDGGVGIDNLENILGSKVYMEVVNRILHLP